MVKEKITLQAISKDLKKAADSQMWNREEWRFSYIIPITLLAILVGVLLKNVLVGVIIFLVAAYHIVRYVMEYRVYKTEKKAVLSIIERGDISISVEKLSHIAKETVYEPHTVGRHSRATKTVTFFHFVGGGSWRVPDTVKHYEWSKDHYLSLKGLENISVSGDEFYQISLQGFHDIVYIYPCKTFELDAGLTVKD